MLKRFFQILVILSLGFLLYYLYKFDYLVFDKVNFIYKYLTVSIFFLWLGFLLSAYSWQKALQFSHFNSMTSKAIYGHGISVFGKYIPGKIWVILGRATFVSKDKATLKFTTLVSLKEQLIYIFLGLLISLPAFWLLDFQILYKILLAILVLGLGLFLFSTGFHRILVTVLNKILRKRIKVPVLQIKASLKQSPYILLYWAAWIVAFYFFCLSINPLTIYSDALSFPLSVSFGVLALVAPGGIGVREGIISTYLIANGWEADLAITTSLISRLWFFSGEVFIFVFALLLRKSAVKSN